MSDFVSLQTVHAFSTDADEYAHGYFMNVRKWRELRERHEKICQELISLEADLKQQWYILRLKEGIRQYMKEEGKEFVVVKSEPSVMGTVGDGVDSDCQGE